MTRPGGLEWIQESKWQWLESREQGGRLGSGRLRVTWGHGSDTSYTRLTNRWWGKECVGSRTKLGTFKYRATPAGRTPSLPTILSDGTESGNVDVGMVIDWYLGELLSERDHGSERFGEGGAGQEDFSSGLEESQLIDVGKTGEGEGQTKGGRGRDGLDGDKRIRRKSDDQGRFDGGQADPEPIDLDEIDCGGH
jgi:hypothetical protein